MFYSTFWFMVWEKNSLEEPAPLPPKVPSGSFMTSWLSLTLLLASLMMDYSTERFKGLWLR